MRQWILVHTEPLTAASSDKIPLQKQFALARVASGRDQPHNPHIDGIKALKLPE